MDNWIYITKKAIHTDFEQHKITAKGLKNLKEEDALFATSLGYMGDEIWPIFILKNNNSFMAYRINWTLDDSEISVDKIGAVPPRNGMDITKKTIVISN